MSKHSHPNLVNLKNINFANGKLELIMELMDADLGELIMEKNRKSEDFSED